jgi:peroxiredoxin
VDAQVLAISTDASPTLDHWRKEIHATYPMLSDHPLKVAAQYGILIPQYGMANRVTFVVDTRGKIVSIQEDDAAIDPSGAETACRRIKKKPL